MRSTYCLYASQIFFVAYAHSCWGWSDAVPSSEHSVKITCRGSMCWTVKTRICDPHQFLQYSKNWPDNERVQMTTHIDIETKLGKHYVPRLPVTFFMLKRPRYTIQHMQKLLEYQSKNSMQLKKHSKKLRQYPTSDI